MRISKLSRRVFLQGAGALVALPAFESLAEDKKSHPSKRMVMFYIPNGMVRQGLFPGEANRAGSKFSGVKKAEAQKANLRFKAKAGTFPLELTPTLKPLSPFKNQFSMLVGLDRTPQGSLDAHGQAASCFMSSAAPNSIPANVNKYPQARSLDHIIGDRIGNETPYKTLEISCNTYKDNKEPLQWDNISWYDTGRVAPSMRNPQVLYNRLFAKNLISSANITDLVMEDARYLKRKLNKSDQQKFGEYFETMRSIEVRISKLKKKLNNSDLSGLKVSKNMPRGEYIRLMCDIVVLSLQNNLTNVSTMMMGPERWNSPMNFEGVFDQPVSHHTLSHSQTTKEGYQAVMKIDRFYMQQFSYMLGKMASIKESDGSSLLDNTLMHCGPGMGDGATHQYFDIPAIIAGGKNLGIKHGRYIRSKEETPLANLWLTYTKLFGINRDKFADSNGTISDILV